jgi:hypothetical protein
VLAAAGRSKTGADCRTPVQAALLAAEYDGAQLQCGHVRPACALSQPSLG